jgi:hypothetical protein
VQTNRRGSAEQSPIGILTLAFLSARCTYAVPAIKSRGPLVGIWGVGLIGAGAFVQRFSAPSS